MIITKEQQEAWISNYVKQEHTQEECIGFIDGVEKVMEVIKSLNKPDSCHNCGADSSHKQTHLGADYRCDKCNDYWN